MSFVRQADGSAAGAVLQEPDRQALTLFERAGGRPVLKILLRHFYADVRQHRLLGPIFEAMIEDWEAHLELLENFWTTLTGGEGGYAGPMPAKHIPLGLKEEHFQAWLGLWEHHCRIHLAPETAQSLIGLAHHIASRLRMICGVSGAGRGESAKFSWLTPFPNLRSMHGQSLEHA